MCECLIAVDIGNSSTKLGRFSAQWLENGSLPVPEWREEYPTRGEPTISDSLVGPRAADWFVVSVHRQALQRLTEWVKRVRPQDTFRRIENYEMPIAVQVDCPERVGGDRLAAAVGVNRIRPQGSPAIVIGAGTAITVDLVSVDGAFQGGAILPGPNLAARSLSENTDGLPLVMDFHSAKVPAVGKSTESAIRSGLFWGTIGSVREVVAQIEREIGRQAWLCVTGGWAAGMANRIRDDIHWVPNLVLTGIAISAAQLGKSASSDGN